jgi:hypothetical protein
LDDTRKKITMEKVGTAWRNWKTRLTDLIRPLREEVDGFDQAIALRPDGIEEEVWRDFVTDRFSAGFQVCLILFLYYDCQRIGILDILLVIYMHCLDSHAFGTVVGDGNCLDGLN